MSTVAAALIVLVVVGFSLVGTWVVLHWALGGTPAGVRAAHGLADRARETDDLELLFSLPAYSPPDPDLDAGCARLWNAILDDRQEGGPT